MTSKDKDRLAVLLKLYEDDRSFSKHHENLRSQASSILTAIAAGLIGLATIDNKLDSSDSTIGFMVLGLGFFGVVFVLKQYERSRLHLERAYQYFHEIDAILGDKKLDALRQEANRTNKKTFPIVSKFKLIRVWMALHVLIGITGIAIILRSGELIVDNPVAASHEQATGCWKSSPADLP